ncbi:MAG: ribosome biogenesis GTPase Der [Rickettsiales bacterium]|nr:ribosome biogenesis GTPase Der [Rickettsiales bacterium]
MSKKIIIAGRPNVGKSSLFNAIIGKKLALVDNYSGLTRDVRVGKVSFLEKFFFLYDTAGIKKSSEKFDAEINQNSLKYFKETDIILLVIDGKMQLTSEDYEIVDRIRKLNKKIFLVINKTEGKINKFIMDECSKLGFGQPFLVSSAHHQNIDELKFFLFDLITTRNNTSFPNFDFSIAVVGKVNSGKSTLINSIKGQNISMTGSQANLTRDTVETEIQIKNSNLKFFDTAGFNKSDEKKLKINKLALNETLRKIRLCQMIIIIMDINDFYERLHSKIIDLVYNEKRCMLLALNKIDNYPYKSYDLIKKKVYELNPQILDMPIFFVSALKKVGLNNLKNGINNQIICWRKRIKTSVLNEWLKKTVNKIPPPLHNGKQVKLKYLTQVDIGPPKFNIFTNFPKSLKEQYKRYLINTLKKNFQLNGLPIKIVFKKADNPYD